MPRAPKREGPFTPPSMHWEPTSFPRAPCQVKEVNEFVVSGARCRTGMRVALSAGACLVFRRARQVGSDSYGRGRRRARLGECFMKASDSLGVSARLWPRRASKKHRFNARFDDVITALETEPPLEPRWSMRRLPWRLSARAGPCGDLRAPALSPFRSPFRGSAPLSG